jgi:hypothetical protein
MNRAKTPSTVRCSRPAAIVACAAAIGFLGPSVGMRSTSALANSDRDVRQNGVASSTATPDSSGAIDGQQRQFAPSRDAKRRILRNARNTASQLIGQSRRAFDRGLMSFADYADHLRVAKQLNVKLAGLQSGRSSKSAVLSEQKTLYQDAIRVLERFDQPGAKGWEATVLHARLMAANADVELAEESGNHRDRDRAIRQRGALAEQFYERSLADYRFGLATRGQLRTAANQLTSAGDMPTNASDEQNQAGATSAAYPDSANRLVDDATPALSGRSPIAAYTDSEHADDRQIARFETAREKAIQAKTRGDNRAVSTAISDANQQSWQLFDKRLSRYDRRTASLYDIARAWQQTQSLHEEVKQTGSKQAAQRQQANLQRLEQLAEQTTDRRGRIAADVTLVRGLSSLEQLKTLSK